MFDIGTPPSDGIGPKERLTILLAEYSSLRAELIQRNTVLFQFLTVSISVAITIVTFVITNKAICAGIALGIFLAIVITTVWKLIAFDIRSAARRVRALETRINNLAGEQLLEWETNHGVYKVSLGTRLTSENP